MKNHLKQKKFGGGSCAQGFDVFTHLFQFIKWEDTEPYNIQELLKGNNMIFNNIEKEYKDAEYEITIVKRKGKQSSEQMFTASSPELLIIGLCSLLQSAIDAEIITEEQLPLIAQTVLEKRKEGARNRVIYNSMKEGKK